MDKKQYDSMNWEAIESIVYADCDKPFNILSVTQKRKNRMIQAFFPNALKVSAVFFNKGKNKTLKLDKVDEAGFFAGFFDFDYESYTFKVEYERYVKEGLYDPYAFPVNIDNNSYKEVLKGRSKEAYKLFGSHKKKYGDIEGYEFIVYAPLATGVSLVGDFNGWLDNANLMQADNTIKGLYKLFIPNLEDYAQYKYVINHKGNKIYKNDPFSFGIDGDNSICVPFVFDSKKEKKHLLKTELELQILEIDACELFDEFKDERKVFSYILQHAKKYEYNAVSFIHLFRSNNPKDIYEAMNAYSFDMSSKMDYKKVKCLVSDLKKEGIYSFIELPLAYASDCESGLSSFDTGRLFENEDPRLSSHKYYKAMIYDHTKPFTKSYLISSLNLFLSEFDFNGYILPNTGVLLYHDYNKNPGEFITEEWGSTLNSKGIAFIKELNRFVHKEFKNALCIASIYAYYKDVTGKSADSLCFDYCYNTGASEEILEFLKLDPSYRKEKLDSFLLFTHFSNNEEKYIYPYSRKENINEETDLYERMPGNDKQKLSNLKMAIIFKHLLKGSQLNNIEIEELKCADDPLREDYHKFLTEFRRIYTSYRQKIRNFNAEKPFSYKCIDNQVFTREYFDGEKDYIIVFNFSNDSYQKYNIPVSHEGVYKEVFNTDSKIYAGEGIVNLKALQTVEGDNEDVSNLTIKLPGLSILAFEYRKFTQKELDAIFLKKKKAMYKFVEGEKKKVKDKLNADIEALKNDADIRIKELEKLLEPFNK